VDRDPTFRKGLRFSLTTSGYAVDIARNAEEALEYVRRHVAARGSGACKWENEGFSECDD
jgi:CheY-like chemotaxis protein